MKTVSHYIDQMDAKLLPIVLKLRAIIKNGFPGIIERISYNIPFYYYNGPLCYINVRKNSVSLGFTKGYALSNKQGLLDMKGRKQVATLTFCTEDEIDENIIKEIILEAASINDFQLLTKKR